MIRTRFPPEPNGYLHLGHLKAIEIDFNHHSNCECILRFDDTNPNTESQEYVDAIIDDIQWLGYQPSKITFTSDYFDQLIAYAEELIKKDLAYVDHSTPEEIKQERDEGLESIWRTKRTPEENLEEFRQVCQIFKYHENQAVLRLKYITPNLRDPIAYRILDAPHFRTGGRYRIFPTYDFSHPIVDALEGITYSYCTTEFEIRRPLYEWLMEKLKFTNPPKQIEFGRLNITNCLLSKRKIKEMINRRIIKGFDDPRVATSRGLKNRGF